ncbi:mycothiol transferase [Amycolatopsis alkalitolerans]|uniref:DUF664 domain-containing protein n=1 Tax=Amycolatopsis alkalitolerans TaxID=2547244 RepID=A0A5C4LSX0_9PSEU|nr:DUF664 domain-containing protein [Amycolatopsis alkalitolerans]TNC21142.1 DUF664 domain-containing protein [Amycolatopsis alkalitolerans]
MITTDEYLYFTDRALDGMVAVLGELGDDLANRRPELPGANTPYGIVTHCIGVIDHWAGRLVAGRPTERDRDAEFRATGTVADLVERVERAKKRLREYAEVADPRSPLREEAAPHYRDTPIGRTQGAALQHVYEELAQHLGQLELTRDVLGG